MFTQFLLSDTGKSPKLAVLLDLAAKATDNQIPKLLVSLIFLAIFLLLEKST